MFAVNEYNWPIVSDKNEHIDDILYRFNPWWDSSFALDIIDRPVYTQLWREYWAQGAVVFVTGLRRIGKTMLMKQWIKQLLADGVDKKTILYISLDHISLAKTSIHDLVDRFRALHTLRYEQPLYLFLDEITYIKDFTQELKNLYDLQSVQMVVSSSSASLLRDHRAFLTGRERLIDVMPLTFSEYLLFTDQKPKGAEGYLWEATFELYMQTGGIPAYVLNRDEGYLQSLVDNILYKDILAHYGLKDERLVQDFFALLMERAGKTVSINKLAKVLQISTDTASRYLQYFESTFLIYTIERFGTTNERIRSPRKLYAGDVGIRNLVCGFRDKGAIFENLVYLTIKKQDPRYVYENANEIDFLTKEDRLIEVKYGRELEGSQKALFDSYPASSRLLVGNVADFKALS